MLDLSAPKAFTFLMSILIAVLAIAIHYAQIQVPYSHGGFNILLMGYVLLVVGNLFRQI